MGWFILQIFILIFVVYIHDFLYEYCSVFIRQWIVILEPFKKSKSFSDNEYLTILVLNLLYSGTTSK